MTAHDHDLQPFRHGHVFAEAHQPRRERALWWVTWITLATMVGELVAGWWSGSLALTADGWHMGTHALALGGAALAMRLAQWAHGHARFAFGGWKIEMLAAYTSALSLLAVAVWLAIDALLSLRRPHPIAYEEALVVVVLGLVVNLVCAWVLAVSAAPAAGPAHAHDHGHHHGHGHHDHHHDHNFRAAYLHVVADALTSVLALVALAGGLWWGWRWLDAAAALVAAGVISQWAAGTLKQSLSALVDASTPPQLRHRILKALESDHDAKVADLHVWQVGPLAWSAVVSIVADEPLASLAYRERLAGIEELRHVTIEVHRCVGPPQGG
ncbi:MAG TPA: CDF family Co(II)/Ni(II) efflux transporter DmeF [Burkholderiaceae bacterium]|nr:CDF family Co(II)/Ni(II) efflux transporter DmeF [Burkholderiaceae bacterium]